MGSISALFHAGFNCFVFCVFNKDTHTYVLKVRRVCTICLDVQNYHNLALLVSHVIATCFPYTGPPMKHSIFVVIDARCLQDGCSAYSGSKNCTLLCSVQFSI